MSKFNKKTNKNKFSERFYAYLSGWSSIALNLLLFGLKLWAGIISNSVAVIADAWHTLSDSISSVIVLFGIKISEKKANKKYPYGFGRADIIVSLILGVILCFVGFTFLSKSIAKLFEREHSEYGLLVIIVTIISILVKEGMAQFSMFAYRKTKLKSLKADAWHHRSDAISSLVLIIGIFFNKYFWWIDGTLGIIIALIIFYSAIIILKENISSIFGTSPDISLIKELQKIADKISGRKVYLHHVHIHKYGKHKEVTFHIYLPNEMTIKKSHQLTVKIKKHLKKELGLHATIYIEPISNEKFKIENLK